MITCMVYFSYHFISNLPGLAIFIYIEKEYISEHEFLNPYCQCTELFYFEHCIFNVTIDMLGLKSNTFFFNCLSICLCVGLYM